MGLYRLLTILLATLLTSPASGTNEANYELPGAGLQAEGKNAWAKALSIYLDALPTATNKVALWLKIASIEHRLKHFPQAIDAYQHVLLLQPGNAAVHKILSEVYAENNRPGEALTQINCAVLLNPNEASYWEARAKIANWNKQLDMALESNQRLLTLSKNSNLRLSAWTQLGSLHSQLHHYNASVNAYLEAIKINPNNAALYQRLAQSYSLEKDPIHALSAINQSLQLDPNNLVSLRTKATLATWLGQYPLAINTYQQILNHAPQDKQALDGLAFDKHLMNPLKEKHSTLVQQPNPFVQLMNTANHEALQHHYDKAAQAIKQAIKLKPNEADLYKKLSEVFASANQPQLALTAINKALDKTPDRIAYLRARGQLAAWAGDKAQSQDSYQQILTLKPHDQEAMLQLAHSLAWSGQTDASIRAYKQYVQRYPQSPEGWINYAEVVSWTGNYIDALRALAQYTRIKGHTTAYRTTLARILALIGRYKSALALNSPLIKKKPTDAYVLTTGVIAYTKALQTDKAIYYLTELLKHHPTDPQLQGIKDTTLTPLRSSITVESSYTVASDTTRIIDSPLRGQYFVNHTTSLLIQGLLEHAAASIDSSLRPVNGGSTVADESAKIGFTTQINAINVNALLGALTIQKERRHGIYEVGLETNYGETATIKLASIHDLYRPYLIPQSPKSISLQIMETRFGGAFQWQPTVEHYVNGVVSYSDLSDHNNYVHVTIWPKARIAASEHWLVTVGVDGDFWHYKRRLTDGYYSPLHFNGYEGTLELYYAASENTGYGFSSGFGMQKDELFPHYYYEEDLAAQVFLGIFTDWALQMKAGYTLRDNPTGKYYCWSTGVSLTRRF